MGVANTIVSYLVFLLAFQLLAEVPWRAGIAQMLSYCAGIASSFLMNSRWTFSAGRIDSAHFGRFLAVQLFLLLASSFFISLGVDHYGLPPSPTWLAVMIVATLANFLLLRNYVFSTTEMTPARKNGKL